MTHFPVVVCLDDLSNLASALAPFDENPTEDWHPSGDAQAKWDWYMIGGRWAGYFRYRPEHEDRIIQGDRGWSSPEVEPGWCDGGPKYALDLPAMREEHARRARVAYDTWNKITAGTPEALPWSVFAAKICEEYDAKQAREEYYNQPRVQVIKDTDLDWFGGDAVEEMQVPEEVYIERARAGAVPGWATLTIDGRWMEKGQMGWWAMNDATEGSKIGYLEVANAYIDSLPDETYLVAVDCHI